MVVRILNLDAVLQATPTPQPTFTPLPTLPPTQPAAAAAGQTQAPAFTPTPSCRNAAEFVRNLSIGDNVVLQAGAQFAKVWQVRNAGDCTWTEAYSLVLVAGEAMQADVQIPLGQTVAPGETVDLRASMVAPAEPGTYAGSWMLQAPDGARFGVGQEAAEPLQASIVIKPQPRPTPS
jgi:hypothetical protein